MLLRMRGHCGSSNYSHDAIAYQGCILQENKQTERGGQEEFVVDRLTIWKCQENWDKITMILILQVGLQDHLSLAHWGTSHQVYH